jgi:Zn-dependent protease
MAHKLGDPTPEKEGRVSLNPLVHADLLGTILLPLLCLLFSPGIILGWGKPVPIQPQYFKHPLRGEAWVGISGIAGNLLLCTVASGGMFLMPQMADFFQLAILSNVVLITFNLLPFPPLDGFYALKYVFRIGEETGLLLSQWGFFIILALIQIPATQRLFLAIVQILYTPFVSFPIYLRSTMGM